MTKYVLTVIDTTGIQNYVFASNNLQQITGASYLVNCATRDWVKEALSTMKHNMIDFTSLTGPFGCQQIEDPASGLDAELIYAGGGNTVIIFSSTDNECTPMEKAVTFTRALTKKILLEAPGLNTIFVHKEFTWDQSLGGQDGIWQKAFEELAERKAQARAVPPLLGRAVTAECVFTSLPAVSIDKDGRLVSAEAAAKIKNSKAAFNGMLGRLELRGFDLPGRDFDQLGISPGEKSMLAVIHIDGNGMGKRLEKIINRHIGGIENNRNFLDEMRKFSVSIQIAAHHALQAVIDLLHDAVDQEHQCIGGRVPVIQGQLPFRPIVFGGDDVTLVCDGRLGLGLADAYLKALNSQKLSDQDYLICRAGVAIVKAHFPFARAYYLAEELCASAKQASRDIKKAIEEISGKGENLNISTIDWHLATSGLALNLEEIRQREYQVPAGELNARPLAISLPLVAVDTRYRGKWRTWANFLCAVEAFQSDDSWADSHNKVKALRETLRSGPDEVKHFNALYRVKWPKLKDVPTDDLKKGWCGDNCLYFDAIEMADLYFPL